jgi:dihydroxyacetone kinase-like protein
MSLEPETLKSLVRAAAEQVIASAPELTALDQAIGDGDHGINMKRGFEAVLGKLDTIGTQPLDEAIQDHRQDIGDDRRRRLRTALRKLLSWRAARRCHGSKRLPDDLAEVFSCGVGAVSARGRSQPGEKDDARCSVPGTGNIEGRGGPVLILSSGFARPQAKQSRGRRRCRRPRGGHRISVRAVSGMSIQARGQAASSCLPSATPWRRGNERHGRHRHRVAFAGHRQRHGRYGAPDGRQRGQGGVLWRRPRWRPRHQRAFDHRGHQ